MRIPVSCLCYHQLKQISIMKLIKINSGNHCIKCRSSESVYCHGLLGDHGQRPFHFSNLDVADENRAIFKYQWDDSATPPPSILEGLLSVLSREDHESAPSTSRKEDEASTGVSDSESDLFYEVLPTFVVQVRSGLVDSEVPALRLDAENREISVDWRNVYTSYFSHCLAGIAQKEIVSVCKIATRAAVFVRLELTILRMRLYQKQVRKPTL